MNNKLSITKDVGVSYLRPLSRNIIYSGSATPDSGGGTVINNQDITVIENGVYTAESGYTGLGEVTVALPLGETTIGSNGVYNASGDDLQGYSKVTVDVQPVIESLNVTPSTSAQTITASGCDGYSPINVSAVTSSIDPNITAGNIKDGVSILGVTGSYSPTLGTKNITTNGTYAASSDNLDGFSQVTVDVSGSSDWYNWKNVTEGGLETSSGTMPSTQSWRVMSNENGYVAIKYSGSTATNVYAYSSDGKTWTSGTLPGSYTWTLASSEGGRFIIYNADPAYGYLRMYYSTNGSSWTNATQSGSFYISSSFKYDGNYWYFYDSGTKKVYRLDIYNSLTNTYTFASSVDNFTFGAGKFLANLSSSPRKTYFYSSNATSWTQAELPVETPTFISFYDNKFVVADFNGRNVGISTDGVTWTTYANALPSAQYWTKCIYANGTFLMLVQNSTTCAYSTDGGQTWTEATLPESAGYGNVYSWGNNFILKSNNILYYSSDGHTWSSLTLDANQTWYYYYPEILQRANNLLVISETSIDASVISTVQSVTTEVYTDTQSPTTSSVVYDAPKVASAMTITSVGTGTITLSDTKIYTRNQAGDVQYPLLGTKTVTSNGTYSAEDDNLDGYTEVTVNVPSTGSTVTASNETGASIQSGDKVWMQRTQGNYSILTTPVISANTFTGIAAENIATGSSGSVSATVTPYVPSTFGLKDYGTLPSVYDNWKILSNGVKYVAFQRSTTQTVNAFAYSDDGKNWTSGTLPYTAKWTAGSSIGGRFIIKSAKSNSDTYTFFTSSIDGVNWTYSSSNRYFNPTTIYANGTWYKLASPAGSSSSNERCIMSSTNGTTWSETKDFGSVILQDFTYGNGVFLTSYQSLASYYTSRSTDCITWTDFNNPFGGGLRARFLFDGTKFICYAYYENTTDLYTSTDGTTWTKQTGKAPFTTIYSIKYNNGLYWAAQANSALRAYSTDGINWTTVTDPTGETANFNNCVIFGNYYVLSALSWPYAVYYSSDGHTWDSLSLDSTYTWPNSWFASSNSDQRADKLLIPSTDSTAVAILGE